MRIITVFLLICLMSMGGSAASGQQDQKWEWPRSTPEEQDLDGNRLNELVELIREGELFPRLNSLLIVRNGFLVLEVYFRTFAKNRLHTLQSVSKSFTSALIGIAIHRGELKNVDEKILDFFPDRDTIENLDERKLSIRIKDLLTMRSGTDYREDYPDSPHHQLNRLETGWDKFYLNRKMISQPGTSFLYDSGGVILLSSLLKVRTGMHADEYAQKFLFTPLKIKHFFWFANKEGHPHTGGGLNLEPVDMAKFGQLYLQKGQWLGKQVVPSDWVEESFKKQVDFEKDDSLTVGYGYLWWILKPDPNGSGKENIYAAMGFKAQYIFVIPEHHMLVVVTGDTRNRDDQRKPIEFLYSHILPAVKR